MKQPTLISTILFVFLVAASGCLQNKHEVEENAGNGKSYAIYAEYARDSNVIMKGGINQRVFNVTEAQSGEDIKLEKDGSITLQPGTYRLTGFSMVTMQTTFALATMEHNTDYPGYCLIYPKEFEQDSAVLKHQLGIGTPGTAYDSAPSLFDMVETFDKETQICVGHQSGQALNNEVYLSVYSVEGIGSPYHVFARVAIFEM